jgi:hypothetical protein
MKHVRFAMIDPNDGMVMTLAHDMIPLAAVSETLWYERD